MIAMDDLIRALRRKQSLCPSGSREVSLLTNLIGPLERLRDGPINEIHAAVLKDNLKLALAVAARSGLKMEDRP
jgi:hypothetical protein